jgi:hypothetical protein
MMQRRRAKNDELISPIRAVTGPFVSEMLTPIELEELRRIGREQSDYFQKAFADPQSRRPSKAVTENRSRSGLRER